MNLVFLSHCHIVRRRIRNGGKPFLPCRNSIMKSDCPSQVFQQSCSGVIFFFPCNNLDVIHRLFSLYRQAKIHGRSANAKVDEMTRLTEKLQGQLERKVFERKE